MASIMHRLATSAAIILLPLAAHAQTAQPASPVSPPNGAAGGAPSGGESVPGVVNGSQPANGVEDIVVTATRRSADLQTVPIAIQAVTATTLKAFNVTGVLQLPTLTSGLVVTPSGGNNIYLRGIGSASQGFNEAQTAIYVDGLYLANPASGIFSFNNIERIEVLKGPQGTLYGRNATAGLISVITRDPGTSARVDASIAYANYDTLTANLYASTPLTDTLAANVAFFHQKQSRGWRLNVITGNTQQKSDETGVEAKLVWRPNEGTKATLGFMYDYNNRNFGNAAQVYEGNPGSTDVIISNAGTPPLGRDRFASPIDSQNPTHIYIGTLKLEQDLGFARLQSLTGYQTSRANLSLGGFPGYPLAGENNPVSYFYEHNKTFSEELQLTSAPSSSRFDWVLGAFYYNDQSRLRLDTIGTCNGPLASNCAPNSAPTRSDGYPSTYSKSVFGDASYRLVTGTHLTVGLRYTDEIRTLSGLNTPLPGYPNSATIYPNSTPTANGIPASGVTYPGEPYFTTATVNGVTVVTQQPGIPTRSEFKKLTYRFVLAQDVGDNIHLFASHNLGFKSGAFNANLFTNTPVRPELLYDTEVGFKSEFLDRKLRVNASFFHYAYKDVQVRSSAPPAPTGNAILLNVASERINGVDADITLVPVRGLTLSSAMEFLDAKYVDFPGATCSAPGQPKVDARGVTVGTVVNTTCNLAGATPQFAAPFSASFGAVYNFNTSIGSFSISANDHHTSSMPTTTQYIFIPPQDLIDASLGWTSPDKRFDAQLFVRNLIDRYVIVNGAASTTVSVTPGAPRTYGVTVGVHF